ncbi:hypothetical protein [Halosegnis marinus]|uniref:hypothetical protein n=1 Tax=Halosegnis marinus TaxID=3034023 RepID=UPI003620E7CC
MTTVARSRPVAATAAASASSDWKSRWSCWFWSNSTARLADGTALDWTMTSSETSRPNSRMAPSSSETPRSSEWSPVMVR